MSHTCSQCGLQYTQLWSLNRHLRKCLNEKLQFGSGMKKHPRLGSEDQESSADYQKSVISQIASVRNEDSQSVSRQSEDEDEDTQSEGSEIGSCGEIDQDINFKSEMGTSEIESGKEEEINMVKDEKDETSIKWQISRTYRMPNQWAFCCEMPRIKKHIRWLEILKYTERPTIFYNLQNASNSQIASLCEIAYNCLKGNTPLERWNYKELCKQRRGVRQLANPDVDIEAKRHEILKRGTKFVETLLQIIQPLLQFNIPRKMELGKPTVESGEDEEGEDEEEEKDAMQYV